MRARNRPASPWGLWPGLVPGLVAAAAGAATPQLPRHPAAPRPELAAVHAVWMADTIAPGESLAIRITGIAGPNGSWTLSGIRQEPLPGSAHGVLLRPAVERVPGDMFIQMEIPLDQVVRILPGRGRNFELCVAGRDTNVCARVRVRTTPRRQPARVRLSRGTAMTSGTDEIVPLDVQATIRSGWVAALEWSEGGTAARRVEDVQGDGAGLNGRVLVRRPLGDPARRITVKAIDGQGGRSAPAVMTLPAR